jgi:hypothetical protein
MQQGGPTGMVVNDFDADFKTDDRENDKRKKRRRKEDKIDYKVNNLRTDPFGSSSSSSLLADDGFKSRFPSVSGTPCIAKVEAC